MINKKQYKNFLGILKKAKIDIRSALKEISFSSCIFYKLHCFSHSSNQHNIYNNSSNSQPSNEKTDVSMNKLIFTVQRHPQYPEDSNIFYFLCFFLNGNVYSMDYALKWKKIIIMILSKSFMLLMILHEVMPIILSI